MGKDPDFLGLGGYQSSGSDASSAESSDSESDSRSVDSAELRAAEAAARLRDLQAKAAASQPKPNSGLPSALDAFTEVRGRPAFLDPEATRPLAVSRTHGLAAAAGGGAVAAAAAAGQQQRGKKGRALAAGEEFDIARLAPPVKGQQQQDKRGPPGAVIEGKAKRYKLEDGPESNQQYTAAQIAMMGGNVEHLLEGEGGGGGGPAGPTGPAGPARPDRGPATKPMPVTDFLDRGLGGAQLPRKKQDRKEKEKEKRGKGQSTHAAWKSEAEMVLRQQYD